MNRVLPAFLLAAAVAHAAATTPGSLVPHGDFEAPDKVLRQHFTGRRGKLAFIRQTPGDNRCAKIEITRITKDKQGIETAAVNLSFTLQGLQPGKRYRLCFDATGTAPRFLLHASSKEGGRLPLAMQPPLPKGASYLEVTPDWKEHSASFQAPPSGACTVTISLWHSTKYGKMFYAVGDCLLIDNITVAEATTK